MIEFIKFWWRDSLKDTMQIVFYWLLLIAWYVINAVLWARIAYSWPAVRENWVGASAIGGGIGFIAFIGQVFTAIHIYDVWKRYKKYKGYDVH